jgi:PPP family 3-phenylpropionic acid transporter
METLLTRLREPLRDFLGHADAYPLRALYFFSYVAFGTTVTFFSVFLRGEGFSGKQLGYASIIGPIMMFLALPLWGVAADRFGRRRCLNLTLLATALLYFRMYWLHGFWPLIFNCGLLAFFATPTTPLMDAVALDWVEAKGKLSYSMLRLWSALGVAVGTMAVGRLLIGHETRCAYLWAMGGLLTAVLFGQLVQTGAPKHAMAKLRITFRDLGPIIRNVPLMAFLAIVFLAAIGSASVWCFYPVYMHDIGGSSAVLGLAIGIQGISEIPFYFLAGMILKRIGIQKTVLLSFACWTLRVFAYAFNHNPRLVIWIEAFNGIYWTLFWVASVEYVNSVVKPDWRATGQSLLTASRNGAGGILGGLWSGFLFDYFSIHFINPYIHLAAQKLFFSSGCLLAVVTVASALYFRMASRRLPVAACATAGGPPDANP